FLRPPLLFSWSADPRALHSFPIERDPCAGMNREVFAALRPLLAGQIMRELQDHVRAGGHLVDLPRCQIIVQVDRLGAVAVRVERSEEHTSELQSRENLVCRLLLEKNKRLE